MLLRISTRLPCNPQQLWQYIASPAGFRYIAYPVLMFSPIKGFSLTQNWLPGNCYCLRIKAFNLIPLGTHDIWFQIVDPQNNLIICQEHSSLATLNWVHTISFTEAANGDLDYIDELDIQAGWLSPLVWLFAQFYVRHCQKRWRRLFQLMKN